MLAFEAHARLLLVAHAVIGTSLVAVSTHLAVWTWRLRKNPRFRRGALRFASIAASLYGLQLVLGNLLYPTYKVRVRAEYLDNPQAISRDLESRQISRARVAGTPAAARSPAASAVAIADARRAARIFDIKEHLVALGLPLALACPALLWAAGRASERRTLHNTALAFAIAAAAVTWFAALVGVVLTSIRSV